MKLISWNVNGIRSIYKKNFLNWFEEQEAEIVCLQEIKATESQVDSSLVHPLGYHSFWHPAEKLGYSGVCVYSRKEPLSVTYGMGWPEFDREGRVLILEFQNFFFLNTYFPNSQRDHARLPFKLKFCEKLLELCERTRAKGKHVVLAGDFNIAHKEIDLTFPKANMNNAGFLPAERAWMDKIVDLGYIDTFRLFEKGPGHYTWWSYRPGVREKNIGWRLDYFVVNPEFRGLLKNASIQCRVLGSDHCPVVLDLKS